MKAIIQAYSPKEVERIARGEQTVKVCKTAPKDTPFKVYMYCTKERMTRVPSMYAYLHKNEPKACAEYGTIVKWGRIGDVIVNPYLASKHVSYGMHGKVVGEYVCERITEHEICDSGAVVNYWAEGLQHSCLTIGQIDEYVGKRSSADYYKKSKISALHIPAVKFYDKPKELSEFREPCKRNYECENPTMCEYLEYDALYDGAFNCSCIRPCLAHSPRGWRYVEELNYGL